MIMGTERRSSNLISIFLEERAPIFSAYEKAYFNNWKDTKKTKLFTF